MPLAVIAADLFDLIQAALPLIFAVGWGLWQMVSAVQGNAKQQPRPAQKPQRPVVGGAAADKAKAGGQQGDLRSEVDDFLRRLKDPNAEEPQRRPEQQRPEQRAPQRPDRPVERPKPRRPRIEVLVEDEPRTEPPPRRLTERPKRLTEKQQPKTPSLPKKNPLAEQAANLGKAVADAGSAIEASVHEKFDHELGSLSSADDAYNQPDSTGNLEKEKRSDAAASIAAMLRDPENVRNAVILNEILRRPTF